MLKPPFITRCKMHSERDESQDAQWRYHQINATHSAQHYDSAAGPLNPTSTYFNLAVRRLNANMFMNVR